MHKYISIAEAHGYRPGIPSPPQGWRAFLQEVAPEVFDPVAQWKVFAELRSLRIRIEETMADASLEETNRRFEALYDAIETGKINLEDVTPRIQQHRERQKQLQAAKWEAEALLASHRVELVDKATVRRHIEDLHGLLSSSHLAERRSFIRSFVKDVKVTAKQWS
ncbi:MAG: resolvase domain protein [Dehalococcoidia bacterium]|nr:resolvase domain protein [Dehalococcoidia bacterium]